MTASNSRTVRAAHTTHGASPIRRIVSALLVVVVVVIAFAPGAAAHNRGETYLYLDVTDDSLAGRVELPMREIETVFGLEFPDDEDTALRMLEDNLGLLHTYLADHVAIGDGTSEWTLDFDGVEMLNGDLLANKWGFAILPFTVGLPTAEVPQEMTVTFDPFLDEVDGHRSILLIANDWKRGFIDNEAEELVVFGRGSRTADIDLGNTSQWSNFTASIELGVDHIRTGPDHIFFVLVLLLPAVLVFRNGWQPADNFGAALWRVLKIVTMFTVAHSITFTLAGMDLLPLPSSKVVESIIALSIAFAALHNLRPIAANKEWAIAFAFGLFHGMGFASLVSDLDISRSTQLVSLLGRNVGIEIGQAFVILVMFPGLYAMRRTPLYRVVLNVGSSILAVIAFIWTIERLFDQDFGISQVVDDVLLFPRSLWLVAVFTAVALVVRVLHDRNAAEEPDSLDEDDLPEPELEPV